MFVSVAVSSLSLVTEVASACLFIVSVYLCIKHDFLAGNNFLTKTKIFFNHFSTIGRYYGTAHYILSIRQAAITAIVTSSFKIFLTQTFPRCGATCYILPSRAMSQIFNGVNFVYRSVEVY